MAAPAAATCNVSTPFGLGFPPTPVGQGNSAHALQLAPPMMTGPHRRVAATFTATPGAMAAPAAATGNFAAPLGLGLLPAQTRAQTHVATAPGLIQPTMTNLQGNNAAMVGLTQPVTMFAPINAAAAAGLAQPATTTTPGNAAAGLGVAPPAITAPYGNPGYASASPSATVSGTALAAALKATRTSNKFTTIP